MTALDLIAVTIVIAMAIGLFISFMDWVFDDDDRANLMVGGFLLLVAMWAIWRTVNLGLRSYSGQ